MNLLEMPTGELELVAERAAHPQVVLSDVAKRGHDASPASRPWPRERSQRFAIDLGVDRGGRDARVPEDRRDLRQRRAGAQQVARERVPQPVRTDGLHPGAIARIADDCDDRDR